MDMNIPLAAMRQPVYVTQPHLPPLEEFLPYLQEIWSNKILTNGGPFHQQLEKALCDHLDVNHLALFSNGTLGLVTALQALRITGEVITTPYSFVATAHSLLWNGIKPVFVDIDPDTLNLDPSKIDAAHAFGVKDEGGSVLRHGDLSVLSFHATKVFNTFEGGAIICPDAKTKQRVDHLKNFGFVDEVTVVAPGINGKMSEINAAFGMLQLQHIDAALAKRERIAYTYREALRHVPGIRCLEDSGERKSNHAYFPILVDTDYPLSRDSLYQKLKENNVYARRYFYPLISSFPMYRAMPSAHRENLPVATAAAQKVLCLPIYPALTADEQQRVIALVKES